MILPLFASIIINIFLYWIEKQNCCGLALEHLEFPVLKLWWMDLMYKSYVIEDTEKYRKILENKS